DILTGGDGNDIIDGGTGADKMYGGAGSNIYYIDNPGDFVSNDGRAGDVNTVITSIDYLSTAVVNNVTLAMGAGNLNVRGNSGWNVIVGNDGDNVIDGYGGADTLTGGA